MAVLRLRARSCQIVDRRDGQTFMIHAGYLGSARSGTVQRSLQLKWCQVTGKIVQTDAVLSPGA